MGVREEFIEIYRKSIHRPGAVEFLEWLEQTDFFEAPASTRFHLACREGLVTHSVHVYERLREAVEVEMRRKYSSDILLTPMQEEEIAICGLLHDVCKANFYDVEMRNRKNAAGNWEKYPCYIVNDKIPYGHGEKSVFEISRYMRLTDSEAFAIRWHMGGFDDAVKGGSYALSGAFERYPLAVLMHVADLEATYLDEAR